MKRTCALVAAVLPLLWAAPVLAAPPSAQEVLRQVYDRYAKMTAYAERAAITVYFRGKETKSEVSYARRRPGMLLASSNAGFGITVASDGSSRWQYSSRLKEYVRDQVSDLAPERATDIDIIFTNATLPMPNPIVADALLAGRPLVDKFERLGPVAEQTLDERPVWVVEIPLRAVYGLTGVLRLYVGRDDLLVYRGEAEYSSAGGGEPVRVLLARVDHLDIELDEAVPAERFQFQPPQDARQAAWLHLLGELVESAPERALVGKPAPAFEGKDLEGNKVSLAGFRGHPLLLIWWATWCPPCMMEIPHIERLYKLGREQGLQVLGIDIGEQPDLVKRAVGQHGISFPVMIDEGSKLHAKYPYNGTPFLVFIDSQGVVREAGSGYQDPLRLYAALEAVGVKLPRPQPKGGPGPAEVRQREALKAYLVGDDEACLEALRALAEAQPKAAGPWVSRGAYYLARGELDQAQAAFERAEEIAPRDAAARVQMARDYLAVGARPEQAVRLAKAATEIGGSLTALSYQVLAEAYLANDQVDEAVKLLTSLERRIPRDPTLKFLLGAAQERQGNKEAALAAYRTARALGHPAAEAAITAITRLEK